MGRLAGGRVNKDVSPGLLPLYPVIVVISSTCLLYIFINCDVTLSHSPCGPAGSRMACQALRCNTITTPHLTVLVPVSDSISNSISLFLLKDLHSQIDNKFCNSCNSNREFSLERNFSVLPDILIFNIDRNVSIGNTLIKDDRRLNFTDTVFVSSSCEDDISIRSQYTLKAVINHSGSTRSGHYTAHVKLSDTWFFCNDTLVSKCNLSSCNPSTVSSLFFQRS